MKKDLYEELGVSKTSSKEELKKAYRRKAKKAHPDCGGDPKAFMALQKAYDILSDDDRRAKYDRTGDTENDKEHSLGPVHDILYQVMFEVLGKMKQGGRDVKTSSLLEAMKQELIFVTAEAKKKIKAMLEIEHEFREVGPRFKAEGAENILAALAQLHVESALREKMAYERHVGLLDSALKELKKYQYELDKPKPSTDPYATYITFPPGTFNFKFRGFGK